MSKKILIVDNEKRVVELLSKILLREGFKVWTATDGEGCLRLAQEVVPDLLILDLLMPGMDGGDVVAGLRENEKTQGIPFLFLTGSISEKEVNDRNGSVGGNTFIAKESDIDELLKQIRKALGISADTASA